MSWWNSSNLTSFASQALKTAQKRIDKVLDIAEDGSPTSSSVPSEEKVESPKSPPPNSDADGDNFWSAWLGDGGSQTKEKAGSEEKETGAITELFTASFKSERAKSKVKEAIKSSSGKSQKEETNVTKSETVETSVVAEGAESVESATSVSKKSSPLKLTTKLGKKKADVKKQSREGKSSISETSSLDEKPGSDTDASAKTSADAQDQSMHENDGAPETSSENAVTKLAITDMVSSVSDGWTVEGWAADGQLEDLLQTSMIQKMEEEESRESEIGTGMTRSLSSSSAVTVQDLEPSLVVADSETTVPQSSIGDAKTDSAAEMPKESENITTEASPSDDVKHGEKPEDVPLEPSERTVPETKADDSLPIEVPSSGAESPATDDSAVVESRGTDKTDDDGPLENIVATAGKELSSVPQDLNEGPPQSVEANSEVVSDSVAPEVEASVTDVTSETSNAAGDVDNDQTVVKETQVSEIVAKEESQGDVESDSKELSDDKLEEKSDTKDCSASEVVSSTDQVMREDGSSVGDSGAESAPAEMAEMKKIPSGQELENSEKDGLGSDSNDQEKKASEWVVEMCQLKDSIASTTASDELSDSNRTITSEDVGELSVDVSDAPAEMKESEGANDLQQEQMTLKVAATNEMVSSTVSSSSSLVKNLEEAMTESVKDNDSHSTASTEKSSEMVRIESGHNSGHTSGDEIETTTSSDIEIISTPNSNGEYRLERPFEFSPLRYALSRTVRHSPPGHKRSDSSSSGQSNWSKNGDEMLSPEAGGHLAEEHWPMVKEEEDSGGDPIETGKLLQKLADMAEVLEAREKKLMELSRESIDLQEANSILRQQLQQSEEAREVEMSDLTTLTEEFTKRLSEAEKKYNNLARERDALKRQLKDTETILTKRSDNSVAIEKLMKEKDQQITELLAEGEKLSKQQLQSNNIIKKLRKKKKVPTATLR